MALHAKHFYETQIKKDVKMSSSNSMLYHFRAWLAGLIMPVDTHTYTPTCVEPEPISVPHKRRASDRWNQYVVHVVTYDKGMVYKEEGIKVKADAYVRYAAALAQFPVAEGHRIELAYQEMHGSREVFGYVLEDDFKGKRKK